MTTEEHLEFFVRFRAEGEATDYISIFVEIWYNPVMASAAEDHVARYADMLAAMGTEPRLRIVRLLLTAHPTGMIAGDIGTELDIAPPPSRTISSG